MGAIERHQFWFWFIILAAAWVMALMSFPYPILEMPIRVVGASVFFVLFFLAPLFRQTPKILTALLLMTIAITTITLWPDPHNHTTLYVLLIYTVLVGKAVFRLSGIQALAIGIHGIAGTLLISSRGEQSEYIFVILYALLVTAALFIYKQTVGTARDTISRNEALFSEYRKMKRQLVSGEKAVRQEERTQIAREIHDSVGHKLTALLMHIEVLRLKSAPETKEEIQELKQLAKDSLEETRNAVKTLKQDGRGGLPAVIQLIRKLEAESLIRIHFTMRHGALTAPLRNDQAIAIYRAVQEALTNIMKHSRSREVNIRFEAPAGSVFRFEVSNQTKDDVSLREGFGLKSMRERIELAGGTLEIKTYSSMFIVRGTLPLTETKEVRT
ncbi:sensor histidine kinase [Salipaludibacillus sp. HK11]|uniref:sensor histidine kinase n=1 Tax=Salipaludibacillus sp. HK11 TaxID=3394320 RepID=UPI0039FBDE96